IFLQKVLMLVDFSTWSQVLECITPIEEVAATGWGDEFSDDEVTPGKVTILEERSD
ncbi:hypothetical protein Tco_0376239, partial [Tanacetum coccineum]